MSKDQQCLQCGKFFATRGIKSHIWRVHTDEGKHFNSRRNYVSGSLSAWNKGLTKETNESVRKNSELLKAHYVSNPGTFAGLKHSDETKKKISLGRIKYLQQNPDKVPYLINHSCKKSYPEQIFENALISSNIRGWTYNFQNGIYSYDFAFIDLKIDVEIDGGTHLSEKVQKIDARRDIFSISDGWVVLRFSAKDVKSDIVKCIDELKKIIDLRS